jgi:valyl-tRNA synthetase
MPFVTEELWAETAGASPRETLLILSRWPALDGLGDPDADAELEWLIALVSGIRSVRSEMNVPAGAQIPLVAVGAGDVTMARLETNSVLISRLARLDSIAGAKSGPPHSAQIVMGEAIFCLPLAGVIDLDAERERLDREVDKLGGEIEKIDKKLANAQFIEKAPAEIVEEQRARRAEYQDQKGRTEVALARLS